MKIEEKRIELIQKINSIESEELMVIVDDMVNEVFAKEKKVRFDKEFSQGIPSAQLRKELLDYISTLPWKK
jgi:hypothetical protein